MTELDIAKVRNSTVAYLHSTRHEIDMAPTYQRQSAVWSTSKKQLLLDSVINGFDIPKIYFHQFPVPQLVESGKKQRYALVDGKQRLEAIFSFLDGDFALASDFALLEDEDAQVGGLTYKDLSERYPSVVSVLNATSLDVVAIRTDDIELIEEMFSRLNEAVPLNAAEKRNALGGPCPAAVRTLAKHDFFVQRLPFSNSRYRYYDLAAKFLYWQDTVQQISPELVANDGVHVRDVKKYRLDKFFRDMKSQGEHTRIADDREAVEANLQVLHGVFVSSDPLLSSIGMVSLYYLLLQVRLARKSVFPQRQVLSDFEQVRKRSRTFQDEEVLGLGEFRLLEFDRFSQSPNDGSALEFRLQIIDIYCSAVEAGGDPIDALATS